MRFTNDIPSPWVIEEEEEKEDRKKRPEENPLHVPEIPFEDEPEKQPLDQEEEERVVIIEL